MFELAAEQGTLWWTEQRALVTTATTKKKKKSGVTRGDIGRDGVRKQKVRERNIQSRREARNSSHSTSPAVITVVTTHVKWNKKYLAAGLLLWLHVSNGHRGYRTVLPSLHSLHESLWTPKKPRQGHSLVSFQELHTGFYRTWSQQTRVKKLFVFPMMNRWKMLRVCVAIPANYLTI